MLGERKQVPATIVYVFDESGRKHKASPREFGAQREERLGSHVRGLGPPPPTQFIVIPQELLSVDEAVMETMQEKRTLSWKLKLARQSVMFVLRRAERVLDVLLARARLELRNLALKLRRSARRTEGEDAWCYDLTEIAEAPPQLPPKRRRPSVV